jgi:apolipoprotein N-acyltransferase
MNTLAIPLATERRKALSLAALSGVLLAMSFPPIPTGVTAFVALVPLLLLLERIEGTKRVFRYAYVCFLVMSAGATWWISGWWGSDPWLKAAGVATNFVHPVLFTVPVLIYAFVRKRRGTGTALVALPFIWTAWEWLAQAPELSFPWLMLGNSQTYDIAKIQFIEYTGVYGATFWIVAVNALVFALWRETTSGRLTVRSVAFALRLAAIVLLLVLPEVHGRIMLAQRDEGPVLRVGIAQPDMDPYEKWGSSDTPMDKLRSLVSLYDSVARQAAPDLVLWPETAVPFYLLQPTYRDEWQWLRRHIDSTGVALLTGFPDLQWYEGNAPAGARKLQDGSASYQSFNSSILIQPRQAPQVYHKSRLTPMSERIPYLDVIPGLQNMLTWGVGISNWGLGNDTTVFAFRAKNVATRTWAMICYETLYPSFVAGFAARGAGFYGVITNDGWFGNSSGPYQLQQYTVLRAIESRRAVARCANNGVSCFIDRYGRVSQPTRFATRGWIAGEVRINEAVTLFSRWGDWFAWLCATTAALILLYSLIKKSAVQAS